MRFDKRHYDENNVWTQQTWWTRWFDEDRHTVRSRTKAMCWLWRPMGNYLCSRWWNMHSNSMLSMYNWTHQQWWFWIL